MPSLTILGISVGMTYTYDGVDMCIHWMDDRSTKPYPVWRRWDLGTEPGNPEVETLQEKQLFELCPLPFLPDNSVFEDDDLEPDIKFAPTPVRLVLRHTPTIVLFATVAFIVEAELRGDVVGISAVLEGMSPAPLLFFMVVWGGITAVFVKSGIVSRNTFLKSSIITSLAGVLALGTVYEAYYTLYPPVQGAPPPHVTYLSSTLLASLVAGMLAYDLLLKGENMFSYLGETNIFDEALYEQFKMRLSNDLDDGLFGVRYGYIFTFLFIFNFVFIWSINGPVGAGLVTGYLFTLTIDCVLLVGVFQFLIGITGLRIIMRGQFEVDGEPLVPQYLPYHPDGHAGFADLGRCAMQINIIMIIMGLFYVWRAYFAGLRTIPTEPNPAYVPFYADVFLISGILGTPGYEWLLWASNYILPIVAYILIVSFWFYYTFWEIHKRMVKGKKETILTRQSYNRKEHSDGQQKPNSSDDDRSDSRLADEPVGEYNDREPWERLYNAPEWPINTKKLAWIISGNAVPVLFSIPTLLPF